MNTNLCKYIAAIITYLIVISYTEKCEFLDIFSNILV